MVGVAVTPVVCFLGQDLAGVDLKPNPDEVAEVFTVPLHSLLDKSQWLYKEDHAPIFVCIFHCSFLSPILKIFDILFALQFLFPLFGFRLEVRMLFGV